MFSYKPNTLEISHPAYIVSFSIFFSLLFLAKICIPSELLIGTGKVDSFSYFAGKAICRSIKNYDKGVTCELFPTGEAADKLTNLHSDSIDLALVSSKTIYDAVNGIGFFQYITIEYNDLRLLMPLYRSPVSLVARRDARIAKLDDLIGKRVNSGLLNTLENQVFRRLMVLKKWNKKDFPLYQNLSHAFSQDYLGLKSGSVQAMLHIGMHPDNSLKQLLTQSKSMLIGLDDPDVIQLIEDRVGFSNSQIEAGVYPGIPRNIDTLAVETLLVASAATDDDTVQLVLNALFESRQQLQYAHPSLLQQQINIATLNDSYLTPHPSALRFFQVNSK